MTDEAITDSGLPLKPVYSVEDRRSEEPLPGTFPYTRGIHRDMYRGKLWTMRQFAGFGTPEDTNARFRQLLAAGQIEIDASNECAVAAQAARGCVARFPAKLDEVIDDFGRSQIGGRNPFGACRRSG